MLKKNPLVVFGIIGGIIIFILALPYLGLMFFNLFLTVTMKIGDLKVAHEMDRHLEEKYDLNFHVSSDSNGFVGTDFTAYPWRNMKLKFSVKENKQGKYVDYFLDAIYKKDINTALERYPLLKNDEAVRVMIYFDVNATVGKKFDFSDGYPDLADSPIPLTIKISNSQNLEEIDREAVLTYLKTSMKMVQEEKLPNHQITSTITVDAGEVVHYYTYTIPREAYSSFNTVEDMKEYEEVKSVKRQS
ncbi:hypothetical protein [Pseudalkalibacillus berkeleyi]|uniref:Uncharacterized protein n=1 Tax=Pseudalkalibacillus berkeleyi TaxID=1069813 RepID=A0ABS9H4V7_9BACL|nr:hypothetical protein [Pseudalkalibacillus berkeleyi]MCF6138845.1 hypothetical protein [Pseudalkalibacillus berkeleyi]